MSWGDESTIGKPLPTYHGGRPGRSTVRTMVEDAGGVDGIRRVDRIDPDGTTHTLYTRGGMPTVITTKPRPNIVKALHGLCRKLAVYVGLTETVAWQEENYLAPTSGHTRYFDAPGDPTSADRMGNPPDYSDTIGDYAILANGTNYLPTDDSPALTSMQWLFEGENGAVRVLGLTLKDFGPMYHSFYVKDYGPFRKNTEQSPYVALTTLSTITITSTEAYIATMTTAAPSAILTRTGGADWQTENYGRPGFDPLDTQMPGDGWTGTPDHVRTSGEFQVQASPNGRQIAVMRGGIGLNDPYSKWHQDKYCQALMPVTIFTVATVDITEQMAVGSPQYVFQWEYHFPDDYSATATVRFTSPPYYESLGTWWAVYEIWNIHSSGSPYTMKECIGFHYRKDGVLKLDTIERDYGAVESDFHSVAGPVQFMYYNSGVPTSSAPPNDLMPAGTILTRTSYQINGGFGWGALGYRCSLRDQPGDSGVLSGLPYYRLTNNVYLLTAISGGPNFFADYVVETEIFTTTERASFASKFPVASATNSHFTTYNPETGILAASNDGTGPICWI